MKKLYRPFIKGTNWALAGLMSLLGFACSDDVINDDPGAAEYGTPHAKFTIKGAVRNEAGNPIEGIGVYGGRIMYSGEVDQYSPIDTVFTDKDGKFDVTFTDMASLKTTFRMYAEDFDGAENGTFKTDSVDVTFMEADFYEEGESWYRGAARKEIDPITLKEEEKE